MLNCKDIEKMIPMYLLGELDYEETRQFIEHVEHCADCYEELSIQTLVSEGMHKLESGNSFNLQDSVTEKMNGNKVFLHRYRNLLLTLVGIEILVIVLLFITLRAFMGL